MQARACVSLDLDLHFAVRGATLQCDLPARPRARFDTVARTLPGRGSRGENGARAAKT